MASALQSVVLLKGETISIRWTYKITSRTGANSPATAPPATALSPCSSGPASTSRSSPAPKPSRRFGRLPATLRSSTTSQKYPSWPHARSQHCVRRRPRREKSGRMCKILPTTCRKRFSWSTKPSFHRLSGLESDIRPMSMSHRR